jgi:hypothetical protein
MANEEKSDLEHALDREDLLRVATIASNDEIKRLVDAENLFEKRHQRKRRSSRISAASQALVGYVALAGFFANAYQSYVNKKNQDEQAKFDNAKWEREFKRAQDADKYRAFFETSALVTDTKNADKRLVGYALLKEFVDDKDYNSKATLMLEESLAQELRDDTSDHGLDEAHRAAVVAILSALSHSSECKELERASRSVDKLARHHAKTDDIEEVREVYGIYVRRLIGRAAEICPDLRAFRQVRRPLRDTLIKLPELGGLPPRTSPAAATKRIAEILRDHCKEEIESTAITECPDVWKGYERICIVAEKQNVHDYKEEADGCVIMKDSMPPPPPQLDPTKSSSGTHAP